MNESKSKNLTLLSLIKMENELRDLRHKSFMVQRIFYNAIYACVPRLIWKSIDDYMIEHADGKLPDSKRINDLVEKVIMLESVGRVQKELYDNSKKRLSYFEKKFPHPYEDEI